MEIGIRLPASGPLVTPERITTAARWAEELGYHGVWLGDHVLYPDQVDSYYPYAPDNRWTAKSDSKILDALLVLSWAAVAGPSLKLGPSVLILPIRNPILLAKRLSTLDYLSGGRVILGAGVGWMKEEFGLIGEPFDNRGKRADEMVALMRQLWSGETVDFQGEFYQVSGARMHPTPVKRTIPIVWGGHSDAALRRVARIGDGWNPTQLTLEEFTDGLARLRQKCEQYGRDPDSVLIIARPGGKYPITAETHERHQALGVHHVIVDPPIRPDDPDLVLFREYLEQVAEVCKLQPRKAGAA